LCEPRGNRATSGTGAEDNELIFRRLGAHFVHLRDTGFTPTPWDAGAVETILHDVGAMNGIDWRAPIGSWSKDTMLLFLCTAYELMSRAIAARDLGGDLTSPQTPLNDAVPW
jgi:hypothetical protein